MTMWGLGFLEFDPGTMRIAADFSAMAEASAAHHGTIPGQAHVL